jgi:hypothetical protein
LFEVVAGSLQIVDRHGRRDHLAVTRRHEHVYALGLDRAQVEDVLLARRVRRGGRALRRSRELVDELVDAGAADCDGGRAAEEAAPREPHQPSGRRRTSPARIRSRFFTTWRYVYGLITCSLTV